MNQTEHHEHDDHGGLHRDLLATGAAIDRRGMLRLGARFGAVIGAMQLAGCGDTPTSPSATTTTAASTTNTTAATTTSPVTSTSTCARVPQETEGPYPGDGSNGPNVLVVNWRRAQRHPHSFAGLSGTAAGVPLNIALTIVSATTCAPMAGRAVYVWHCDREGRYSLYTAGATNQNYLRGVQEADGNGRVTFQSIYPGCYAGRWPHIHFEVYQNLAASASVRNKIATSQIALPSPACDLVYAMAGYEQSVRTSQISLASDGVFSDGAALELATMSGDVNGGMTAMLTVGGPNAGAGCRCLGLPKNAPGGLCGPRARSGEKPSRTGSGR